MCFVAVLPAASRSSYNKSLNAIRYGHVRLWLLYFYECSLKSFLFERFLFKRLSLPGTFPMVTLVCMRSFLWVSKIALEFAGSL